MYAFLKWQRIILESHPTRRQELDEHLFFCVRLSYLFGESLYQEYQKQFAAHAAHVLYKRGICVNWAKRNEEIYTAVFSGRKTRSCSECGKFDHTIEMCPLLTQTSIFSTVLNQQQQVQKPPANRPPKKWDPVYMPDGREICVNWNRGNPCKRTPCPFAHGCLDCKGVHRRTECRRQTPPPPPPPPQPVTTIG